MRLDLKKQNNESWEISLVSSIHYKCCTSNGPMFFLCWLLKKWPKIYIFFISFVVTFCYGLLQCVFKTYYATSCCILIFYCR